MAPRLQHCATSFPHRLADACRLCRHVLTATGLRRSAIGWARALARCSDQPRNEPPDSSRTWMKVGGNVSGHGDADQHREAQRHRPARLARRPPGAHRRHAAVALTRSAPLELGAAASSSRRLTLVLKRSARLQPSPDAFMFTSVFALTATLAVTVNSIISYSRTQV